MKVKCIVTVIAVAAVALSTQLATAQNREIMHDQLWPGGPTYGKLVEQFFGQYVFPTGGTYNGIGVSRDSVNCESVRTNGRGGYWIRCRARYSGKVFGREVGVSHPVVHYDNGGVRVDVDSLHGLINTRSAANAILGWVQARLPHSGNPGIVYKIWIENPTSKGVFYRINGQNVRVGPHQTNWHTRRGNADFNVEFDWSFASGSQIRRYRLTQGTHYYFALVGNGLDLYHR